LSAVAKPCFGDLEEMTYAQWVRRFAELSFPWVDPTWQIRTEGIGLIIVVTLLACAAAAFWWPIWTGQTVSRSFWVSHMFLSSWI